MLPAVPLFACCWGNFYEFASYKLCRCSKNFSNSQGNNILDMCIQCKWWILVLFMYWLLQWNFTLSCFQNLQEKTIAVGLIGLQFYQLILVVNLLGFVCFFLACVYVKNKITKAVRNSPEDEKAQEAAGQQGQQRTCVFSSSASRNAAQGKCFIWLQ